MSIASEITRLQTAKAELKTAIEGKGVAVSSSAKLDDYPNLVDAIQQGGTGNLQAKSVTYTPSSSQQTDTVAPDSGYDGLSVVNVTVDAVANGSATTPATTISVVPSISINTTTGVVSASVSKTQNVTPTVVAGYVSSGTAGTITVSGSNSSSLSTVSGSTITPTESEQTAVAANKYTLGAVKVGAIPTNYVGSGITQRDSTDLTESGALITAPSGYYAEDAELTVQSGSATPTATITDTGASVSVGTNTLTFSKTVSNTPQVSEGYIASGTAGNTAISLSASVNTRTSSDLTVSGATVTAPSGYYSSSASKSVASGSAGTPTATKGTVSNHSVSVTPSVTNTTGYITGSTKTGTAVTVSASELVSGTKSISANGTGIDVTNYASVDVAVPSGTPTLQSKTLNVSSAGTTTVTPDTGYDGLDEVEVNVPTADSVMTFFENEPITMRIDNEAKVIAEFYKIDNGGVYCQQSGWVERNSSTGEIVDSSVYVTARGELQLSAQAATTITPTTSAQTAVTAGKYTTGAVTVAAMPTGTAGTPTATKGTVSNHSVSVTPSVTNTTGYITGSTKTGTAVSVSASELVSGTVNITSSGNTDVTNYATASVASGSATASATKGTVSNHSVTVTPSVTRTAGYITAGTASGTAVTVSASELVSGSETKTINGTYDVTNLAEIVVDVQGGGGGGMTVATETTTLSTASSSIQFTGLSGQPTSFVVTTASDLATGASPYKTAAVVFDGTDLHGQIVTNTSNANASYSTSFTQSYSNGTLTITGSGTNFQANQYKLIYTYGGTSANIGTAETQVGSGATSITFTGLSDDPDYFSVIFKSNFGTSSGYQRVMSVAYDGVGVYGVAMDSGAKALSSWSYTYNNGTLTVSSQGTNNGGYFHQPGYYQLTYGVGGTVEPTEIEVEPLSVTTNGTYTAPAGKAYSPVMVNVSGGGATVASATETPSSDTLSISFTVSGKPIMYAVTLGSNMTANSTRGVVSIMGDMTNSWGSYAYSSNRNQQSTDHWSASYSNGTLTITSSASTYGYFKSNIKYNLLYCY